MSYVQLENVTKNFAQTNVINGVDLRIDKGEFVVFVGPSGCGKSTLLRLIAGLEAMSSGRLFIGGQEMTGIDPSNRGIAMVFQSYALFPHMTVEENITFGMRMNRFDKAEIAGRLERAAAMLHLTPLLKRKPAQLSGGQRQRVAIGRAIVRNPNVFLFDEPLSNLDAALRHDMRTELLKLHRDLGATMIYVTHDQVEAMTMADKIVVLNGGRIEQVGSPLDLYLRPANLFVAEFLGSPKINTLKTSISAIADGSVVVALPDGGSIAIDSGGAGLSADREIILAVRPEHLRLGEAGDASMEATVELVEHLGSDTILNLRVDTDQTLTVKLEGVRRVKYGERVAVGLPAQACMIFDTAGKILVESRLA